MNPERWTAVDAYLAGLFIPADPALDNALETSAAAGLPPINVAPNEGKFLHLLARLREARNILEIGSLGGYSTIWLARALPPGGRLVSLELDPKHAAVARRNISRAGLADVVTLHVAPALETLQKLIAEKHPPFDFVFIDADKESYPAYFTSSLRLSRVGTCIVADNIIRQGAVIEPDNADPRVQGVRRFLDALAAEPRVTATAMQTVGGKGYDGFAIALVSR
ncbi:MAG TPA: O-methyltransferase [Verrucomicrobiae bacterium]|nr:O-methyltransferase [Verrucomicrobiae bacterium]